MNGQHIRLAFYGDDFTGSTDVLESLTRNGVQTVLFLSPPSPSDLEAFPDVEAIGVAGKSRTMTPAEMDKTLPPVFETLAELNPQLVHYKVCSTFDSSPDVGSIGRAIELAQDTFGSPFVPLVVAAPPLAPRGRYVIFGNLYATVDGQTYRIDRHPTMRNHPITPMTEADIRRHLGEQTDLPIGLVDILSLVNADYATEKLNTVLETGNEIVCFDTLDDDHMRVVGELIWEQATNIPNENSLFTVGSSGLEYALIEYWDQNEEFGIKLVDLKTPESVDHLVVMSGSASPVTNRQIEWALENGFEGIRLNTVALIDPDTTKDARENAVAKSLEALEEGSVVCYAARGPEDPAIEATQRRADELNLSKGELGQRLGEQQGLIVRRLVEEANLERVCVAGGDTSGHVAPNLDVYALEFAACIGPGSPLCRGHASDPTFDGLELALKGGQVETVHEESDYFEVVRTGGTVEL